MTLQTSRALLPGGTRPLRSSMRCNSDAVPV
jgi:hypothetical protein